MTDGYVIKRHRDHGERRQKRVDVYRAQRPRRGIAIRSALGADITRESEVGALVSGTCERFGRIDVPHNNHGIMVGKPFLETPMQEFDRVVEVNLRSVFLLSLQMRKRGGNHPKSKKT